MTQDARVTTAGQPADDIARSLMPVLLATRRHLIDCPPSELSTLANWAAVSG